MAETEVSTGRGRWRSRIGRVAFDVVGVIFAVLVALAADEWRENRQLEARAAQVRTSVLAELRSNRDEILSVESSMDGLLGTLNAAVDSAAGGRNASVAIDVELPSLSDAAWRMMQVTDAASRIDFAWMIEVARIYSTQASFEEVRAELLRAMGGLGGGGGEAPLRRLRDQLGILIQFRRQLLDGYDEVLQAPDGGG